jgi:hypothetical protein
MQRKRLGRYIVADPEICHGKPTFVGTRIMVKDQDTAKESVTFQSFTKEIKVGKE